MSDSDTALEENIVTVSRLSNFCAGWIQANRERLDALESDGRLSTKADCDDIRAAVNDACNPAQGVDELMAPLRQVRNERMFIIAWRDLLGQADLAETLAALSELADACIETALRCAENEVMDRYGHVRNDAGDIQRLVVIGMGKLGGRELNFSSDIDLIFAYGENGETDGAKSIEAQEFYKRQIQQVVRLLNEATEDGFVYRVDTRLRPFGDAGAMAASLAAMEGYYQNHGREWERYAWIKARPVAGDIQGGQKLIKLLRPFVYRRYLDFSAFESIREMKAMIDKQVEQRGVEHNIKIGRGGIREVEFIAQAFQLIRGGHEPELQDNRLLPVLEKLQQEGHMPPHAVRDLHAAYEFLRRLENRLQMWDDRQTHTLPETDEQWQALAKAMATAIEGADSDSLKTEIEAHRERVHQQFQQVFSVPQVGDEAGDKAQALRAAWLDEDQDEAGVAAITQEGFTQPDAAWKALQELRNSGQYRSLSDRGRRRLGELIPLLIQATGITDDPDTALKRVLSVLEGIIGRTTYIALLVENPTALSRFVSLCAASSWISRQIQHQPVLLDSLLDPRLLYKPPRGQALVEELERILAPIPADDLEHRMDSLRRFRHEQMLRIAAADVSNSMPLMVVSDHLTELAEVILREALSEAWDQLTERYGKPTCADGSVADFIIVGYGKMGGLELGYGSDLDVVFLHNGKSDANTDGERALSHHAFFLRLAQRVIHILATQTGGGRAYEIDTRLRPSGKSGLLVTSLSAFRSYQQEKAWTWEHQALVRARAVAGDEALSEQFKQTRNEILAQPRDASELAGKVVKMRQKMRAHLDGSDPEQLDVKQMPGGLIDIEFFAQYSCLLHAPQCSELLIFTDTIRILETLESAQLLDLQTTQALTGAYREYRRRVHRAALQEQRASIGSDELQDTRDAVSRVWENTFGSDLVQHSQPPSD